MKKRIFKFIPLILVCFFIVSCTFNEEYKNDTTQKTEIHRQETQKQTETGGNAENAHIEQSQTAQNDEARRKADDLYGTIKHEVDVIISDKMRIGQDHYQSLVDKLNELEKTIISKESHDEIRGKIEQIKNQNVVWDIKPASTETPQDTTSLQFNNIEREINVLYEGGNVIGPEHYSRLKSELEKLEQKKYDVIVLRQKLDKLNPDLIDANKTTPLSPIEAFDKKVFDTLPDCTNQKFTVAPVDVNELYDIGPLGGIGVPGHTLPTPHMYLHISASGTSSRTVPLKSLGDIYIIDITTDENVEDYSMTFALCKDVFGYFRHIKQLSDEIKKIFDATKCENVTYNPANICTKNLLYKVNAGTLLGYVGGLQGNFDLGAYDYRIKLDYVNQASYGNLNATGLGMPRLLSVVCPLDLFEENIRSQLYSKVKRKTEPRCGNVMQDSKGTLQGSWFYSDGRADLEWAKHLSFVHDNSEQPMAIVAVAGTISKPIKWTFTPQSSGEKNRKFSDVKPDGNIYCYEGASGKIIVQLMSDTELKIEYQSGVCNGNYQFIKPFDYHR